MNLPHRSIPALLDTAAQRWGARVAMRRRREPLRWGVLTWSEVRQQVQDIAAGLLSMGVQRGDRLAILASTRLDWQLVDLAILSTGAISVPVYHSYTPAQIAYVLNNAEARICFVDTSARLEKLRIAWDRLRSLRTAILMDPGDRGGDVRVTAMDDLVQRGRRWLREEPDGLERRWKALTPHERATFVYTSGTSGVPKGVVLEHGHLLAALEAFAHPLPLDATDVTVAFLPLSHIFGRVASLMALHKGFSMAYAQRLDDLGEVFLEVRPTFLFAVPRVYERIHARAMAEVEALSPLRRHLAILGAEAVEALRPGAPTPPARWRQVVGRVADDVLFAPVREQLGGRVRFAICGGAPLPLAVSEFMRLAGVEVVEGYGLTETSAVGTLALPGDNVLGTVGRPLLGMHVQIAADGEIRMRGAPVFHEYHQLPMETREAFDEEGWFRTGDLGEFLPSGHLRITGRKKDLIITSGGKNVAPQRVEALLRSSPLISEAVVFGDRRPHLVALIVPNRLRLAEACESRGLDLDSLGTGDPRVSALIEREVERLNQQLARFESVRRVALLPGELSVEDDVLTPTLKPRRAVLERRYGEVLNRLYAEVQP